jgi:hypothetical protein
MLTTNIINEKAFSDLSERILNLEKRPTVAAEIRWAGNAEKHDAGLKLIKDRFNQNKNPGWYHSDYINWLFEIYKDENGTNPFKTIKDDDGKTVYKGIGRKTLGDRVINMFQADLNSPHLIKGVAKKPKN